MPQQAALSGSRGGEQVERPDVEHYHGEVTQEVTSSRRSSASNVLKNRDDAGGWFHGREARDDGLAPAACTSGRGAGRAASGRALGTTAARSNPSGMMEPKL